MKATQEDPAFLSPQLKPPDQIPAWVANELLAWIKAQKTGQLTLHYSGGRVRSIERGDFLREPHGA